MRSKTTKGKRSGGHRAVTATNPRDGGTDADTVRGHEKTIDEIWAASGGTAAGASAKTKTNYESSR